MRHVVILAGVALTLAACSEAPPPAAPTSPPAAAAPAGTGLDHVEPEPLDPDPVPLLAHLGRDDVGLAVADRDEPVLPVLHHARTPAAGLRLDRRAGRRRWRRQSGGAGRPQPLAASRRGA